MTLSTRSNLRLLVSLFLQVAGGFVQATRGEIPSVVGKMPEDSLPTLKSILEIAAKQSPTVLSRSIQLEQAEANVYASTSQLLPNVGGSFSFASTTVYPSAGDSNRSSGPYYNLGVSQPIYQWNALKNQAEISKIGVKISQKNYADGYRGLLGTLRSQFLGLIYQKLQVRTQRFNFELTKKYLALDEERLKAGSLSPVELIIPRMNGVEAQLAMARSDEAYDHSKRSFVRLAGIDSLPEDSIPLEVPTWTGSNELVLALAALLQRDGVDVTLQGQVNTLNLKQDDLSYKIAKVRLYPKLSASAGVSQSNSQIVTQTYASQSASRSYNYGIAASWTIFDGFAARGAKLTALASKRSHELDRAQLTAALTEDVRNLGRVIDFSAQYLKLAEERHSGAAQAVDRVKDELSRGTVSPSAVDTAIAQLYSQDGAVAAARLDLLSHWSDLVSLLNVDPMLEKLPPAYVH